MISKKTPEKLTNTPILNQIVNKIVIKGAANAFILSILEIIKLLIKLFIDPNKTNKTPEIIMAIEKYFRGL